MLDQDEIESPTRIIGIPDNTMDQTILSITAKLIQSGKPKKSISKRQTNKKRKFNHESKSNKKRKLDSSNHHCANRFEIAETHDLQKLPIEMTLHIFDFFDSNCFKKTLKTRFGFFNNDPSGRIIYLLFHHTMFDRLSRLISSFRWPKFVTVIIDRNDLLTRGYTLHSNIVIRNPECFVNLVLYEKVSTIYAPLETHCIQFHSYPVTMNWFDIVCFLTQKDTRKIINYVYSGGIFRAIEKPPRKSKKRN